MVAAEQVNLFAIGSCLVLFGITYQEEYCVVLLDFLFFLVCGFCSVQTRQWILNLVYAYLDLDPILLSYSLFFGLFDSLFSDASQIQEKLLNF